MRISLEEEQLEILETLLNKIIQSFDKFSENTKGLILAIEKLTEETRKFLPPVVIFSLLLGKEFLVV